MISSIVRRSHHSHRTPLLTSIAFPSSPNTYPPLRLSGLGRLPLPNRHPTRFRLRQPRENSIFLHRPTLPLQPPRKSTRRLRRYNIRLRNHLCLSAHCETRLRMSHSPPPPPPPHRAPISTNPPILWSIHRLSQANQWLNAQWAFSGVSRTLTVTYIRPVPEGERVLVESEVVHAGKRLCSIKGVMKRERDGAVMATCEHGKVSIDPEVSKL